MRANLAKIFGGIAILLIILILVGFLRPAHWTAEVSVESHLDPDVIFTYLNDLENGTNGLFGVILTLRSQTHLTVKEQCARGKMKILALEGYAL